MYTIEAAKKFCDENKAAIDGAFDEQCKGMSRLQRAFVDAIKGYESFAACFWMTQCFSKIGVTESFIGAAVSEFMTLTTPRPGKPCSEPFSMAVRMLDRTVKRMSINN